MTAQEIIAYLEAELADAYDIHDEARGKDARQALALKLFLMFFSFSFVSNLGVLGGLVAQRANA